MVQGSLAVVACGLRRVVSVGDYYWVLLVLLEEAKLTERTVHKIFTFKCQIPLPRLGVCFMPVPSTLARWTLDGFTAPCMGCDFSSTISPK